MPYAKELEDSYYPATLTHDDYPDLIPAGGRVDTVAVCAVLVSFNWNDDSARYRKIGRFVDRFFGNFDEFLKPPHHPKWREVNYAATLEGWHRSPLAQSFIDRAKATAAAESGTNTEEELRHVPRAGVARRRSAAVRCRACRPVQGFSRMEQEPGQ